MEWNTGFVARSNKGTVKGEEPERSPVLQQGCTYKGMYVTLISEKGKMCTLVLPKAVEGKYTFPENELNQSTQFVTIEASGNEWFICCNARTCFIGDCSTDVHRNPLHSQNIYYLNHDGIQYMLYAEKIDEQNGVFQNYFVKANTSLRIGYNPNNDIHCMNKLISREHAVLTHTQNEWKVIDQNSANGVYVNSQRVTATTLMLGDVIYIMGLRIIIGTDFLSICSGESKLELNPQKLQSIKESNFFHTPAPQTNIRGGELFNRRPRSRYSMEWPSIEVASPPMPMNANKMPLVLRLGPSAVMGTRSIMMGSYSMILTSLVFPFLSQRFTEKERKEYEERRKTKYTEYLNKKQEEIRNECEHEFQVLNKNYPVLDVVLQYADSRKRLWERRKSDDDFLQVRVGSGTMPMRAEIEYQKQSFEMERDELEDRMYLLAEQKYNISGMPIMLSLKDDYVCGILGDRTLSLV